MPHTSISRLADAIINDVNGGLRGYHTNMSMSKELLELDIVDLRLLIIKEYMLKGILPVLDLLTSINCIPVDCDTLDKCRCNVSAIDPKLVTHFLIPQLLFDYGLGKAIYYIGSTDKQQSFIVYTKPLTKVSTILKYRKRGRNKPWVYIDVTPNSEGLLDCYIFGAPFIKLVSVIGIFKDPRLLEEFLCNNCEGYNSISLADSNFNFIDTTIKERLVKQKIYYYRQLAPSLKPNDLSYNAG